jgi:hypothetical protein
VKPVANALDQLAAALDPFDIASAEYVRAAKSRTPQTIADDLNLWGGSGSLMDQALRNQDRVFRRPLEAAAIVLGHALQTAGARNARMEQWISVFESWANDNV